MQRCLGLSPDVRALAPRRPRARRRNERGDLFQHPAACDPRDDRGKTTWVLHSNHSG